MTSVFAPSRSYGSNSGKGTVRSAQPELVDILALQNAARVVQERITRDVTIIPDLGDTLASCAATDTSLLMLSNGTCSLWTCFGVVHSLSE